MEAALALLHVSSTCARQPLTVPQPSSTPLYTIYAPTGKLEILVKPMKNKERYKTPKVSDKILTSSIEHDIKTRFGNDDTNNCIISNSNPKPTEPHFSEKCPSPGPEAFFHTRIRSSVASQDPQTSLFASLVWHIRKLIQPNEHNFDHYRLQNH